MLYLFIALPTLVPPACWVASLLGWDPWLAASVAAIAIFVGIVGILLTAKDKLVERWCWLSTGAHLGWELPFVVLSHWLKGATEHDKWACLFWAYGTADKRYLSADPGIVGIESLTSFIVAPMVVYVLVLLHRKQTQRAYLFLIVASACQLYGAVLYFLEEAFRGFTSFTNEPIGLWIKVVGLNGIWLVMPAVMLYKLIPAVLNKRQE